MSLLDKATLERMGDKPMKWKQFVSIFENVVLAFLKELKQRIDKLEQDTGNQRAVDLEMRVRALEDRPPITYRKTWTNEETYKRGDFVTWGGSMWHCDRQESRGGQPGASSDWSLAVMRGRAGKQGGR